MCKDTLSPSIAIDYPYEGDVYNWAPYLELDISDANLDLRWYTLNEKPGNYYFTEQFLGIDQGLWFNLDDGVVTITIHATDKAGNENSYELHVIKQTYIEDPYYPPYYPPYLAITIGGILMLGIIITIVVVVVNKKSQPRAKKRYYDQIQYRSQPPQPKQYYPQPTQPRQYRPQSMQPKQYEYLVPNRRLKCPYCSNEEDIDGNFCPRCGAKLK